MIAVKKRSMFRFIISMIMCVMISALYGIVYAGAQKSPRTPNPGQTQINEFVDVVNIEVLVRALKKKELVGGLKKSDFTLYENDVPLDITSFQEVRRKVGLSSEFIALDATPEQQKKMAAVNEKRLFFIYFWISEPDPAMRRAIKFFFKNVYRDGDYVLIMIRNRMFRIVRKKQVEDSLESLLKEMEKEAQQLKFEQDRMVNELNNQYRDFLEKFRRAEDNAMGEEQFIGILDDILIIYKNAWTEYSNRHTTLSAGKLKSIAASLKSIEMEKWGIVFYQHDIFPQFNLETISSQRLENYKHIYELRKDFGRIYREMRRGRRAVAFMDEIQQAFIEANTTFHLMLSDTKSYGELESVYLKLAYIHSDWQDAFRNITLATGGDIMDNNKLNKSLVQAVEKEDIYYRLTYAPAASGTKDRRIRVTVADNAIDLKFHRTTTIAAPSDIQIDKFSYNHPLLTFTIRNYRRFYDGSRLFGDVGVKITRINPQGKTVSAEREFSPHTEDLTVTMKLKFPSKGKYTLTVEAFDWQTGKTTSHKHRIEIPGTIPDIPDMQNHPGENAAERP